MRTDSDWRTSCRENWLGAPDDILAQDDEAISTGVGDGSKARYISTEGKVARGSGGAAPA